MRPSAPQVTLLYWWDFNEVLPKEDGEICLIATEGESVIPARWLADRHIFRTVDDRGIFQTVFAWASLPPISEVRHEAR